MIACTKSLTHFLTTQWFGARVRLRAGTASVRSLPGRWAEFRPMRAILLLILLAAMAAFSPLSLAATRWVTVQLTDNDHDDYVNVLGRPLSNRCAVWSGEGEMIGAGTLASVNDFCQETWREGGEVVLHDGISEIWRTDNGILDTEPHINNLGQVVWEAALSPKTGRYFSMTVAR